MVVAAGGREAVPSLATPLFEAYQDALLDALPGHAALLDGTGVIIAVNDAWRRFADANDYRGGDHGIGTSYFAACSEEGDGSTGEVAALIRGVMSGRRASGCFVYPCHAPWQRRWYRMFVSPLDIGGRGHVLIIHFDATLEVETQLAMLDELERAATTSTRPDRLAEILREVKSPLGAISGMAEAILLGLAGPVSDKQHDFLSSILAACSEIRGDIDSKVVALLDAEIDPLQAVDDVDVAPLLAELAERHAGDATAAAVEIRCDIADHLPHLAIPRAALRRMIGNLIVDGIERAGTGTTLTLAATTRGGNLVIEVFHDAAAARGRVTRSDGDLGLRIVRELAMRYGVSLAMRPEAGRGHTVELAFRV